MKDGRRRTLELREAAFGTPEELHAELARALDFPPHYGGNFAALSDCLGDVTQPTRLVFVRSSKSPWFEKFCTVAARTALENPALSVRIDDERA